MGSQNNKKTPQNIFSISFMNADQQTVNHNHKHVANITCSAALLVWKFKYHTVCSQATRGWHFGGYIYKIFSEGTDRSSAARLQYTSRVSRRSCSRSSCTSASTCLNLTRTRSRCDRCSLRVLKFLSSGCQRECLEREKAVCDFGAARLATCGNWCVGVPGVFSPLVFQGYHIILKP